MENKKPIYKKWWAWVGGIIILFILIGSMSGENEQETSSTTSPIPTLSPAPASQSATWQLVKSWTGTSAKKTEPFTITGKQWRIAWTNKDTTGFGSALLQVYVYKPGAQLPSDVAVNATQEGGDISYIYKSGEFYLDINALSKWTVKVEELR